MAGDMLVLPALAPSWGVAPPACSPAQVVPPRRGAEATVPCVEPHDHCAYAAAYRAADMKKTQNEQRDHQVAASTHGPVPPTSENDQSVRWSRRRGRVVA